MCSLTPTAAAAAPRYSGCKRPYAVMVSVHDPAAAEQRADDGAGNISADSAAGRELVPFVAPVAEVPIDAAAATGQMVPYVAPSAQAAEVPIDAVPLAVAAPNKGPRAVDVPAEPWWISERLLRHLKLRIDLPVHFICEKAVTVTDLDPHQNRFRLPTDGVRHNLRPILSPAELDAAHLLHDGPPRPKAMKKVPEAAVQDGTKQKKQTGKKHGGLPVLLVNCEAGIMEMTLAQWESSRGTIIKGDGYVKFINASGLKEGDMVDIWAFKQRPFHYFGVTMCDESPLYLVFAKKDEVCSKESLAKLMQQR